jgi:hypothetical protein
MTKQQDDEAIVTAANAIKTRLQAKTPKGETSYYDWIPFWKETFDVSNPSVDPENDRIRDGTLQRLLASLVVRNGMPGEIMFTNT